MAYNGVFRQDGRAWYNSRPVFVCVEKQTPAAASSTGFYAPVVFIKMIAYNAATLKWHLVSAQYDSSRLNWTGASAQERRAVLKSALDQNFGQLSHFQMPESMDLGLAHPADGLRGWAFHDNHGNHGNHGNYGRNDVDLEGDGDGAGGMFGSFGQREADGAGGVFADVSVVLQRGGPSA
jgi:hypothetical protein